MNPHFFEVNWMRNRFLKNSIQFRISIFFVSKNIVFLQKTKIMNLSQEEWVSQLEADNNAVILDVRTEAEWDQGVIENAVTIDFYKTAEFMAAIEALDKTKNYYVYCRSGARSGKACEIMNELGIENAFNLEGGMLEWSGDVV
jgi:rhodanese-related sulfurtransferase